MTNHTSINMRARLVVAAAIALTPAAAVSGGATEAPYVMRGNQHIWVGITLDEAVVRAALPEGLEPAEGITGGLNIYTSQGSDTVAPFTRSYVWADLAGRDSLTGAKGRFILWAANSGGTAKMEHLGYQATTGSTALSRDGKTLTGTATVDGSDVITVSIELKDDPCGPASGVLHYPSLLDGAGPMVITQYSWASSTVCGAVPVSVDIPASDVNQFAKFAPTSVIWAAYGDGVSVGASPPFQVAPAGN
jgi:hypothetical protein